MLQGNVKEAQYDVDFFKSFDLVMNGLDNLEARRHVNRLCLAAETPLIESGTAGYLGQVVFHYISHLLDPSHASFRPCTHTNLTLDNTGLKQFLDSLCVLNSDALWVMFTICQWAIICPANAQL